MSFIVVAAGARVCPSDRVEMASVAEEKINQDYKSIFLFRMNEPG